MLLFPALREEDGGSYTCTATNAVASDAQTVNLVVKGEGKEGKGKKGGENGER